jgi:putative ABC transport system permease protein
VSADRRSGVRFGGRAPVLALAGTTLSRNRVRTALATLGIVIGVFAIAALGVLGTVLEVTATETLGDLGTQVLVTPDADAGLERLTDRQVRAIERVAGDATVVPLVSAGAVASAGDSRAFVTLYGVEEPRALFEAGAGDLPARHRRGAVVGADVARDLDLEVGRTVTIEGREFRVVAVLAEPEGIELVSGRSAVLLPPSAFADPAPTQVVVRAESSAAASRVAAAVDEGLNARGPRVDVLELGRVVARVDEFFALLNTFLLAIGSVSLLVAAVAILNVMLMSVRERRREIGVLRAVGVQRADVLRLILAEAALLGVAGAFVGALLAVLGAAALWALVPEVTLAAVANPTTALQVGLAVSFGVGVSLLSGLYPAWEAASARPVEALRDAA